MAHLVGLTRMVTLVPISIMDVQRRFSRLVKPLRVRFINNVAIYLLNIEHVLYCLFYFRVLLRVCLCIVFLFEFPLFRSTMHMHYDRITFKFCFPDLVITIKFAFSPSSCGFCTPCRYCLAFNKAIPVDNSLCSSKAFILR